MFVTKPMFEFAMPKGLGPPSDRYWRAVSLSVHLPWFVLWWQPVPEGLSETLLIADEDALLSVVQRMLPGQLTSMRVVSLDATRPCWEATAVSELLRPLADEQPTCGPLLMRLAGRGHLVGRHMQPVEERPGRQMLLQPLDQL